MRFPTLLPRRRRSAIAVCFAAAGSILLVATPAVAHVTLQTVAPANDSLVESMPTEVVLQFDEKVSLDLGTGIRVLGVGLVAAGGAAAMVRVRRRRHDA